MRHAAPANDWPRVSSRPTPGFDWHGREDRRLLVDPRFAAATRALSLLEPDGLERRLADGTAARGRGRAAVVSLPDDGRRLVLRPVLHGGLLGPLLGGALWGLGRPVAELLATARLRVAGAPVPEPVCVVGRRRLGPLWNAAVGTLFEEHTEDALAFLAAAPAPAAVRAAATAAGTAVRAFHDAGGRHADLHVKNLLLRREGERFRALVIDLDRARCGPPPDPGRRLQELARLHRSLLKRGLAERVGARGCARFLAAYVAGDRVLRRALLAHAPRERRRLARHQLAWRLLGR